MKCQTLREKYKPLLSALKHELYQSKLHLESREAIESLLTVVDSYRDAMLEDMKNQIDMQQVINEQKEQIVNLERGYREFRSMLAISQKDVSKLQKQLKEKLNAK